MDAAFGNFTLINILSLLGLAISGSILVVASRRIILVIKKTERVISRTVDEKNLIANELRLHRREETQLKQAIDDADSAIALMTKGIEAVEARTAFLKEQATRQLTMVDSAWRKFDRVFEGIVTNPSMPNALPKAVGGGSWGEGRAVHGFARAPDEFRTRVEGRYSPAAGFMLGDVAMIDLNSDGGAASAARK